MQKEARSIIKADGRTAPFVEEQLINSLERVGATEGLIHQIIEQVQRDLGESVKSSQIYRLVYNELRKRSRPLAARYKLRRAVQELGPSGYPFEAYIGEIFRHLGYEVQVGLITSGKCIQHEIDVLADKENRRIAIECKFGNSSSKRIDVKVPLYIRSRFEDLRETWRKDKEDLKEKYEMWIVTNAEFTEDAQKYGVCAGLNLVSWKFPNKGNLKDLIEHSALYPITALASLTKAEKKSLLKKGVVLAREILHKQELLEYLHMSPTRKRRAVQEVEGLCI